MVFTIFLCGIYVFALVKFTSENVEIRNDPNLLIELKAIAVMKTLYPANKQRLVSIKNKKNTLLALLANLKSIMLFTVLIQFSYNSISQTYTSGNPGLFGIDGDLNTEKRLNGTFTAAGSHDWFKINAGTSLGVFDTLNADNYRKQLASGKNIEFSKKMQFGAYTIQNGYLMLDGSYSRDYIGNNSSLDKTIFVASNANNKNHLSPENWLGNKTGDVVPSKSDIVDTYIHMRRQGNSIEIGNPSNLIVYLGASTMSTGGDHYIDFELFKTDIAYNNGQGKFTNTGPTATGGRNIWEFNTDGSIKQFGEMLLSFAFSSTQVSDISIYIWVPYNIFATINPAGFDFVPGSFTGAAVNSGYGFAKIQPNSSSILPAWGMVNTTVTEAPLWGTTNKEDGSQTNNYFYTNYSPGQFAEAAIDLTALGIDPALSQNFDKCTPPYKRVVIKTRASSALSSTLIDFAGPFVFLDAPTVSANITDPGLLTCNQSTLKLSPADYIIGADYVWSTSDGNIVNTVADGIFINKPGTYTLTASLYDGCTPTTKTRIVTEDKFNPVVEVTYLGALTTSLLDSVTLMADTTSLLSSLSNLLNLGSTPPPSTGVSWSWSGPNGFVSDKQKPKTNKPGTYNVTVTESRNGCTDTKSVILLSYEDATLPLKISNLNAYRQESDFIVNWKSAVNNEIKLFEVEISSDGTNFKKAGYVLTDSITNGNYIFKQKGNNEAAYFRVKAVSNHKEVYLYSNTIKINAVNNSYNLKAYAENTNAIILDFNADRKETVEIALYNTNGQQVSAYNKMVNTGFNKISIPKTTRLQTGAYIITIKDGSKTSATKIIL